MGADAVLLLATVLALAVSLALALATRHALACCRHTQARNDALVREHAEALQRLAAEQAHARQAAQAERQRLELEAERRHHAGLEEGARRERERCAVAVTPFLRRRRGWFSSSCRGGCRVELQLDGRPTGLAADIDLGELPEPEALRQAARAAAERRCSSLPWALRILDPVEEQDGGEASASLLGSLFGSSQPER